MKKAILVLSISVVVIGFSSCTKLYNCNCTTVTTDTITKEKITTTKSYKQSESSKKLADAKCQQNAFSYNDITSNYSTTCTLETVKK
jgi:hypothetical protein